jgi:putative spermidine/putrescine transport system substrate-binding protein
MKRSWNAKSAIIALPALAILGFTEAASADSMDGLMAAAQKEGQLNVIALPRDWCGYGVIIDGFTAKYGLTVKELHPDVSSEFELEAIKANQGAADPDGPDVIDVGLSFGPSAKKDGLLQPYKVSNWSTIPDSTKDADGYWYGDYYGVLVFEINSDIVKKVPVDWPELLAPEYKNSVALAGVPNGSNQAIQGVFAVGLAVSNGSVNQAADQGLKFLAELDKKGNFVPFVGQADSLARGATPILIRWDYLALGDRDRFNGNPKIEIVVPKTGVVAGVYVQAISAFAPHPNAAKLWMEHLYSDEAQLALLSGYCHPIRFKDLMSDKKVPVNLLENLPEDGNYANDDGAVFPSMEQQEKAREIITNGWDAAVGVEVRKYVDPDPPSQ